MFKHSKAIKRAEFIMHADRGQNLRESGMLQGDFREAVHREQRVLVPDLNGIKMANIIHLNRFIFPVDEFQLEAMQRAHLSWEGLYVHVF